jgi:hypothetical protein
VCSGNISNVRRGSTKDGGNTSTTCQEFLGSLLRRPPRPRTFHLPFRLSVEKSTGRVDIDHLLVNQSPVTLLWVFLGSITEEPTAYGLLYSDRGLATGDHIQLVSIMRIRVKT